MARSMTPWNYLSPSLLDDFGREMHRWLQHLGDAEGRDGAYFAPTVNVAETEKSYDVTVDLPGMKPEDFNLEFKDGQLWITGERKHETEEKGRTYHRVERSYGQFRRVIAIGADIDTEKVEATYKDGVLSVTVPKAVSVLPKRIQVKS